MTGLTRRVPGRAGGTQTLLIDPCPEAEVTGQPGTIQAMAEQSETSDKSRVGVNSDTRRRLSLQTEGGVGSLPHLRFLWRAAGFPRRRLGQAVGQSLWQTAAPGDAGLEIMG